MDVSHRSSTLTRGDNLIIRFEIMIETNPTTPFSRLRPLYDRLIKYDDILISLKLIIFKRFWFCLLLILQNIVLLLNKDYTSELTVGKLVFIIYILFGGLSIHCTYSFTDKGNILFVAWFPDPIRPDFFSLYYPMFWESYKTSSSLSLLRYNLIYYPTSISIGMTVFLIA